MLFCSVRSCEERTSWLWSQAPALAAPVSVTRAGRQVSKTVLERHGAASVTGKMIHCTPRAPEPIAWAVRRLRPPLLMESFFLIVSMDLRIGFAFCLSLSLLTLVSFCCLCCSVLFRNPRWWVTTVSLNSSFKTQENCFGKIYLHPDVCPRRCRSICRPWALNE